MIDLRRILCVVPVVLALASVSPAPVSAHDGSGILTVEEAAPIDGSSVRYVVRLTWTDDGHAALDATVTAVAFGPDLAPSTPALMEPIDDDGRYEVAIPAPPGAAGWDVRFTSITPTATSEAPGSALLADAPPPSEPPASSADPSPSSVTTASSSTSRPGAAPTVAPGASEPVVDGASGGGALPVVVALVAGGALLGAFLVVRSSRSAGARAGHQDDAGP